jgi:hypothetical protein
MLDHDRMRRVAEVIIAVKPERVSFRGGEPLIVPWWGEALVAAELELNARAQNGIEVSVTDVRSFLPTSPLSVEGEGIGQIEPDGQLRAFACYEAKIGNVLDEPIDVLWERAIAWRNSPFVRAQTSSIHNLTDWARAARALDRRYGSEADKVRIANRN